MIWLLISVVLLIVLIFFRIDILLVAPIVSVFLCLVSGLDVVDTLAEGFMPAFATFAKNNFLIFMTSAMFARAMQDTGMAASIARGISSKLGPRFAIPCVFFVSALLGDGLATLRSHTDLKLGACKLFAFVRHNYILLLYFWNLLKFKSHGTFGEYACIHELEVG